MPHYDPKFGKQPPRTDWGRWLLLGAFALVATFMVVLVVHALVVRPAISRAIDTYTAVKPTRFEPPPVTEEEKETIEDRVEAFFEPPEPAPGERYVPREPLQLSENEVNALIVEDNRNDPTAGGAKLALRDNAIVADLSLPIEDEWAFGPLKGLQGRYLNGTATIELAVRNGTIDMKLTSFNAGGHELPEWLLKILERETLQSALIRNDDVREALESLDRLEIADGQVTLVPKTP